MEDESTEFPALTEKQKNSPGIEDWVELKRIGRQVSAEQFSDSNEKSI